MSDILLSVIVPVYNSADTLEKCISSIINQNIDKMEVIIIDNGSTDDSWIVCSRLGEKFVNVKAVRITTRGVSVARNEGLNQAEGQYVTFCDADDWLEAGYFQFALKCMAKLQVSLFSCNYFLEDEDGLNQRLGGQFQRSKMLGFADMVEEIVRPAGVRGFCWNKIYSRELLSSIYFQEQITVLEDLNFNLKVLEDNCKRTAYISSRPFYHYVQRNDSRIHFEKNDVELYEQLCKLEEKLYGNSKRYIEVDLLENILNRATYFYSIGKKQKSRALLKEFKQRINFEIIKFAICNYSKKIAAKIVLGNISFSNYVRLYILLKGK